VSYLLMLFAQNILWCWSC